MAGFYSARSETIPPLPWPNFAPPFPLDLARGAEVSVLHVYDAPAVHLAMSHAMQPREREAYIEELRQEAARKLSAFMHSNGWRSVRHLLRREERTPAEEILATAKEEAADLVVVGTHGRGGLAKLLLGSVAEAVLRRADKDVLAVPAAVPT